MRDDAVLGRALPLDRGLGPAHNRPSTNNFKGSCHGLSRDAQSVIQGRAVKPTQYAQASSSCQMPPIISIG